MELRESMESIFRSFSAKAMMDIERFQHQKVVDLKDILADYCILQFKLVRKVKLLLRLVPYCSTRIINTVVKRYRDYKLGNISKVAWKVCHKRISLI